MASDGPPNAYAALILLGPWPGMSTTVSRRIDSVAFFPPPMRRSRIESLRDGPPLPIVVAPGSLLPLARASEPRTRIVFGEVSGNLPPVSWADAASEILDDWIWAETRKRTRLTSSQTTTAPAAQRRTRPTESLRRRVRFRNGFGMRRRRPPWTS